MTYETNDANAATRLTQNSRERSETQPVVPRGRWVPLANIRVTMILAVNAAETIRLSR
jgi:hypothetical protein